MMMVQPLSNLLLIMIIIMIMRTTAMENPCWSFPVNSAVRELGLRPHFVADHASMSALAERTTRSAEASGATGQQPVGSSGCKA